MKVGDLVLHDHGVYPWGIGIVMEVDVHHPHLYLILWSKTGLSWETCDLLEAVDESR